MRKLKFILESLSTSGGELVILLALNLMYSVAMYFKPDLYRDSHNLVLGALLLIIKTNYNRVKTEYDRLNSESDEALLDVAEDRAEDKANRKLGK